MTQTAKIVTLTIGAKVFHKEFENFERVGEVITKDGKIKVLTSYLADGKTKTVSVNLSDKWQPLPGDAPADVLASVIAQTESVKKDAEEVGKDAAEPEAEIEKEPEFIPLTGEEIEKRKKLVSEYKRQDANEQNAYLRKCEIIHEIRSEKLFRGNYKTFAEFAAAEFGVTREYAQNLAQIGEFYSVSKDFIKGNKLSVNSINQLIRNQNKLAGILGADSENLSDYKPLIEKVIETTIEAAKNEKGKINITPRIVDEVANQVSKEIAEIKSDKTGADLIALASKVLGDKASDILIKTRETLAGQADKEKSGSGGKQTSNNDNSPGVYVGVLSSLEIKCTLHSEFKGNKVLQIGNGTLQTKCLCRFKIVGFDLIPYEIEGKRVKNEK